MSDITPGVFTSTSDGQVPASGGGTVNFLRADGTWQPPGGSTGSSDVDNLITVDTTIDPNKSRYVSDELEIAVTDTTPAATPLAADPGISWPRTAMNTSAWRFTMTPTYASDVPNLYGSLVGSPSPVGIFVPDGNDAFGQDQGGLWLFRSALTAPTVYTILLDLLNFFADPTSPPTPIGNLYSAIAWDAGATITITIDVPNSTFEIRGTKPGSSAGSRGFVPYTFASAFFNYAFPTGSPPSSLDTLYIGNSNTFGRAFNGVIGSITDAPAWSNTPIDLEVGEGSVLEIG